MKLYQIFIVTSIGVTLSINAASQTKAQKIDSVLKSLYAENKISGSFLVAEGGKIIYNKGFGFTENEAGLPLNDNSVFELASISKQFTAIAIMMLKLKGKLDYNASVVKYLPELSAYKNITINHLLNHTSGIPDVFLYDSKFYDFNKPINTKDIIAGFSKHSPKLLFEPGTKFEYSNAGYLLLASVIEKVSGKPYNIFMQEAIFHPLKMKNTFVNMDAYAPKHSKGYVKGFVYLDSLKKYIPAETDSMARQMIWSKAIYGPSKIWSTTSDLFKWDRALHGNKLIPQKEIQQIFQSFHTSNNELNQYSFGWYIEHFPALGNILSHGGSLPGYKTFLDMHVDSNKSIIILQNHEDAFIPLQQIRAILANQPLKNPKTAITLPDSLLAEYEGVYLVNGSFKNILKKDSSYYFFTDGRYCKIYFINTTLFFNTEFPSEKEFIRDSNGKVTGYRLTYFGDELQQANKISNPDTLMASENFFNEAGWHFLENKKIDHAIRYLKRGEKLHPSFLMIKANLAHRYLFSNDYDVAIQIYKQHLNELVMPGVKMSEMIKQDYNYFLTLGFDSNLMNRMLQELNIK